MPRDTPQIHIARANSPLAKTNDGIAIAGQAARPKPHRSQPNTQDKQSKQQGARNKDSSSRSPKGSISLSGQSIKGQSHRHSRELRTDSSSNTQGGTSIKGQAKGRTELSADQIQIKERASKRAMQNEGNCKLARHKRPKKGSRHDSVVGIVGSATSEAPDASQPEAIAQPAEEITISGRALKKRENSPAGKRERAKHKRRSLFGYQMSRVLREEQAKDAKNRERRVSDPATAASNSSSNSNMIATSIQSAPMHSLQRKPEVASVPIEVLDVNNAEKQQRHVVMRDVAVSTNKPSVKAREEQKNTQCKEEQSDIELNATIDF